MYMPPHIMRATKMNAGCPPMSAKTPTMTRTSPRIMAPLPRRGRLLQSLPAFDYASSDRQIFLFSLPVLERPLHAPAGKLHRARTSLLGRRQLRRAPSKPLLQEDAVCEQPVGVALVHRFGDLVHLLIEQHELLPQHVE